MAKIISNFALVITVTAVLYLLISQNMFSASVFVISGQVAAIALSVWARRSFKKGQFEINAEPGEGELIRTGPYRFIRHPMYSSALLLIWSSILGHVTILNVIVGFSVVGVIVIRIIAEDKHLNAKFSEYAEYSRKVKRLIPFLI